MHIYTFFAASDSFLKHYVAILACQFSLIICRVPADWLAGMRPKSNGVIYLDQAGVDQCRRTLSASTLVVTRFTKARQQEEDLPQRLTLA